MDKNKIKVVKRGATHKIEGKAKRSRVQTSKIAAREMVSTVSEWVSEIKQRKTQETRVAFDMLFTNGTQPRES